MTSVRSGYDSTFQSSPRHQSTHDVLMGSPFGAVAVTGAVHSPPFGLTQPDSSMGVNLPGSQATR